jgi:hypothetical protein
MDHETSATPAPPVAIFAIADRKDDQTGYTFTVTFLDPTTAQPATRWLHDRLHGLLNTTFSPAIETTDNTWTFFLPDSIIAPEACYSYSPSDQLRRDLTDAFATLFSGRHQRTRRSQPTPTVHLDDSVTEVDDIDDLATTFGPRRSRRLAKAAKARNGLPGNDQKDDTNSKKGRKNQSRRR